MPDPARPAGKATRRTAAARAKLAAMDGPAISAGRTFWLDHAPPDLRGLIDAESDPQGVGLSAGPAAAWRFLGADRLYQRIRGGAKLAAEAVRKAVEAVVAEAERQGRALADRLVSLKLPIPSWQAAMEALVKRVHAAAGLIGGGGRNAITPDELVAIEARVLEQFEYLEAFAVEVEEGLALDGRIAPRAESYATAGVGTYEGTRRVGDMAAGFAWERRVRESSESCEPCIEYEALGWQPAGTLPGIGQSCDCTSNCHCRFERSKNRPRAAVASALAFLESMTTMNLYQRHAGDLWAIREDVFLARLHEPPGVGLHAGPPAAPVMDAPLPPPYGLVNGVAVIPVYGTIYRHSTYLGDLTAWATGGVSLDRIRAALAAAVADPAARSILFTFDSPGGQAAGIGELAASIRKAGTVKPVAAFVEAACCSGAYWLACAAGEIVAAAGSFAGSIGVVSCVQDTSAFQEKIGIRDIAIVSSQSPAKYPDVATDTGRAVYQDAVDSLAAVFIADVAKYRGVESAVVLSDFGGGRMLIAADARKAGMIDRVGTFDSVLSKLSGSNRTRLAITRPAATSPGALSSSPLTASAPLRVRLKSLTRP